MAKKARTLPGYKPLGGSSRQYVSTRTGEIISRRRYQTLQNKGQSPEQRAAANRLAVERGRRKVELDRNTGRAYRRDVLGRRILIDPLRRYRSLVQDFKSAHPGAKVRGTNADLWRKLLTDLRSKDNRPDGKKARALVALGRRHSGEPYPVGSTPTEEDYDDYDPSDYFEPVEDDEDDAA